MINAKLEPYLGFLHSLQEGKASLVCDFEELYRYLIDDFVISYCQELKKSDFTVKPQSLTRKKLGKGQYLKDEMTREAEFAGKNSGLEITIKSLSFLAIHGSLPNPKRARFSIQTYLEEPQSS